METIDPTTVRPTAGNAVVQIVEVLGGQKNGLFRPSAFQGHMGKDTAFCKVIALGDPPHSAFAIEKGIIRGYTVPAGQPWPVDYLPVQVGDILLMPRDIPKVFVHEELRYGIVHLHEAIAKVQDIDAVEVKPWQPQAMP